jgi:hypothetical protein
LDEPIDADEFPRQMGSTMARLHSYVDRVPQPTVPSCKEQICIPLAPMGRQEHNDEFKGSGALPLLLDSVQKLLLGCAEPVHVWILAIMHGYREWMRDCLELCCKCARIIAAARKIGKVISFEMINSTTECKTPRWHGLRCSCGNSFDVHNLRKHRTSGCQAGEKRISHTMISARCHS